MHVTLGDLLLWPSATIGVDCTHVCWPVAGASDSGTHKLRMPAVSNGDCAGRFAAELDVMTYSAINLAISQLTSAERCALSRVFSLLTVACLC
jgi:hypothetical protein